jgi:hypothetical protein
MVCGGMRLARRLSASKSRLRTAQRKLTTELKEMVKNDTVPPKDMFAKAEKEVFNLM